MGTMTKEQRFPYSFKSVAVVDKFCISFSNFNTLSTYNMIGLEVIQPRDFYACEGLYAHLRFSHDGLSTGRDVRGVYVTDDTVTPTYIRSLTGSPLYASTTPPGGFNVDARIDLTALKNTSGRNIVLFDFDAAISGTIKMFKLDMLYQVVGIR